MKLLPAPKNIFAEIGLARRRLIESKKSQTELLGFSIVVLLIAVGLLFVIGFVVLEKKVDNRVTYLHKQTATNLNDALLETTTKCRSLTVRELYLICMEDESGVRKICPLVDNDFSSLFELSACDYLHGFIEKRLDETLGFFGNDYKYSYLYDDIYSSPRWSTDSNSEYDRCPNERSSLILSGDTHRAIIFLDIFNCQ